MDSELSNCLKEAYIAELEDMSKEMSERPPWSISLSFERSKSNNYDKAVKMAQKHHTYSESMFGDCEIVHSVVFTDEPKDYRAYRRLYDIVKNWHSLDIQIYGRRFINQELQLIDECFRNKECRISARFYIGYQWASEYVKGKKPFWLINVELICKRVLQDCKKHIYCPTFNPMKIADDIRSIPNRIDFFDEYWVM